MRRFIIEDPIRFLQSLPRSGLVSCRRRCVSFRCRFGCVSVSVAFRFRFGGVTNFFGIQGWWCELRVKLRCNVGGVWAVVFWCCFFVSRDIISRDLVWLVCVCFLLFLLNGWVGSGKSSWDRFFLGPSRSKLQVFVLVAGVFNTSKSHQERFGQRLTTQATQLQFRGIKLMFQCVYK